MDNHKEEDLIEPDQVISWADAFGVSPAELRAAIEKAGPLVANVRSVLMAGQLRTM